MSRIHEIPVVVVGSSVATTAGPATSAMLAILNEIEAKLEALVADNQESSIDLRWLMESQPELDLLRNALGEGEVTTTITNIGRTLVQETAVPCVWWITHRDSDDRKLGEFVEITEVPELLRSDRLSIKQGLAGLQARRAQINVSSSPSATPHQTRSQS